MAHLPGSLWWPIGRKPVWIGLFSSKLQLNSCWNCLIKRSPWKSSTRILVNTALDCCKSFLYSILNVHGLSYSPHWNWSNGSTLCMHLSVCLSVWQFLAATKQLYKWYFPSVCPSGCSSVWLSIRLSHLFLLCSHHCIIMKFWGIITNDQSKVHAKAQCQRSKVKVTEVTTQLNLFRTVTPVWIHIWWWNDAHSLMLLRKGALLFFKVICQISRSHGSKKHRIWPRLGISGL